MNLFRLFHTLKYLKPVQVYGRLWFRLYKVKPDQPSVLLKTRKIEGNFANPCTKDSSFFPPYSFKFLNVKHDHILPEDWNNSAWDKLWVYNLHYFDDLQSYDADTKKDVHNDLINKWVQENPHGLGNGWEPYPVSLRTVNWIKWALKGNNLSTNALYSLAVQAHYLYKKPEFHLLGNHLLANAKALVFAGLFFMGSKAKKWLEKGLSILESQLDEQVLDDGGHFERSPMYHAIILEDILDLINISQVFPKKISKTIVEKWCRTSKKMICAMDVMNHPDGEIAFFNDSAKGIAASLDAIVRYAIRLGVCLKKRDKINTGKLPDTGYYSFCRKNIRLIVDIAPIGPNYLPAHAHADTLSFELSIGAQRVLVNSGTSCYGISHERLRQRRTPAHNTLTIDSSDSSEVWKGFRVARRARIIEQEIKISKNNDIITGAHDGFKRLKGVDSHYRTWHFSDTDLIINDRVTGSGVHLVSMYYHFHPMMNLKKHTDGSVNIYNKETLIGVIKLDSAMDITINKGTYHPEFGLSIQNQHIVCKTEGEFPMNFSTRLNFI